MHAPDMLLLSIEKLMLDVTEPLDPLVGLKLVGLSRQITELVYMMGHQDGQRQATTCPTCPYKALG
jgi:hypothetical protein